MPKPKKPAPFMIFVKERYPNLKLEQAIERSNTEWATMSQDQKDKYKVKAKTSERLPGRPKEKLTSQGVPFSFLDREREELETKERVTKKEIEDIVNSGRDTGDLINIKFNFIMVNYFGKNTEQTIYLPAEIALATYSLKEGVVNKYHSLVNPAMLFFGHAYEAQQHADEHHQLPLPPKALGETDLGKLYSECLEFVHNNNKSGYLPPLFTLQENIKEVEGVLNYMMADNHDNLPELRVYSIQYLFYILKQATSEIGENPMPGSMHITDAILERDIYEYESGISCDIHEKKDRSKYCALSCVIRWGYVFSDNLCLDLGLQMEPGHHVPIDADLTFTKLSTSNDTKVNDTLNNSIITQPKIERSYMATTMDTASTSFVTDEQFPKLGAIKKKNNNNFQMDKSFNTTLSSIDGNDINPTNPWSRNKKCRPATESSFAMDFSVCENESTKSRKSSGRGFTLNQDNDKRVPSKGRGILFDK